MPPAEYTKGAESVPAAGRAEMLKLKIRFPSVGVLQGPAAIFELAVPFAQLDLNPGNPVRFYVELYRGDSSLDRAPREGIFELTIPSPDFERIMWQV